MDNNKLKSLLTRQFYLSYILFYIEILLRIYLLIIFLIQFKRLNRIIDITYIIIKKFEIFNILNFQFCTYIYIYVQIYIIIK